MSVFCIIIILNDCKRSMHVVEVATLYNTVECHYEIMLRTNRTIIFLLILQWRI